MEPTIVNTDQNISEKSGEKKDNHPPERMRAVQLNAPGEIIVVETGVPKPKAGQVLIKLEGSGICPRALSAYEGQKGTTYPLEPGAPGNQGWGTVTACGEGVKKLKAGDRVAAVSGHAYAEYDVAYEKDCIKIPENLEGEPFPAKPLGLALELFNRVAIKEGETVGVVGVGFLGALLIQMAKKAGAKVIAVSRASNALDIAQKFGADELVEIEEELGIVEEVDRITEGVLCDVVLEAEGFEWSLNLATNLVKNRGRLMVINEYHDNPGNINLQQWSLMGLEVINGRDAMPDLSPTHLEEAMAKVSGGEMDPSPLYTHFYHLQYLAEALEKLKKRPAGFMKAFLRI